MLLFGKHALEQPGDDGKVAALIVGRQQDGVFGLGRHLDRGPGFVGMTTREMLAACLMLQNCVCDKLMKLMKPAVSLFLAQDRQRNHMQDANIKLSYVHSTLMEQKSSSWSCES